MRHSTEVDLILDVLIPKDRKELMVFTLNYMNMVISKDRSPESEEIVLAALHVGLAIIEERLRSALITFKTDGA